MAESQEGYQISSSELDDVPIIGESEKWSKSKIQHEKSSDKTEIRWVNVINHSDFFMRYKLTVFTAIYLIIALLLSSAMFIYIVLQTTNNYRTVENDERIIEERPATESIIIENNDKQETFQRVQPTDREIYEIISGSLKNLKKREIHKIQKRQVTETSGVQKNSFTSNMRLQRVETGSRIPRETEIISGNNLFFNAINKDSDEVRNNEKREIERKEKMSVCKRNVEHCKSVLNSMKSLVKTTGDNVENLNKLVEQIRINERTENVDKNKFKDFLDCIECQKSDSIVFPDDFGGEDLTASYNYPMFNDKNPQLTNIWKIDEILDNPFSNADDRMEETLKNDGKKLPNVVNENIFDGNAHPNVYHSGELIKQFPKVQRPSVNVVHVETSTKSCSGELNSPKTFRDRPIVPVNAHIDARNYASDIYSLPGRQDSTDWEETTRTHAIVDKFPSSSTVTPVKVKSDGDWRQQHVSTTSPFQPRIATGTKHSPMKPLDNGNAMKFPSTAEATATGQQIQYTPQVSFMPYPICFFNPPSSGPVTGPPFKPSMPGTMTYSDSSSVAGNYPLPANQFPQRVYGSWGQPSGQGFGSMQHHQRQGFQYGPGQQYQYGHTPTGFQQGLRVGPTAPGIQGFLPNFGNVPTGRAEPMSYYCTYVQPPTYQFPPASEISDYQRTADNSRNIVEGHEKSYPFPDRWRTQEINSPGYAGNCDRNHYQCNDGSRCVLKTSWCDGRVDCPDASDETKCSCRDRVNKERICDGYFDCPRGEDELGCFGCSSKSFSCEDWTKNKQGGNCVPLGQRCDGLKQCPNGKDEMDCSILTQFYIENRNVFTVGFTNGYLHKNWQGRWYPVCTPTKSWAMDACLAETGLPLREFPHIDIESIPPAQYPTPYLTQSNNGEIKVVPTCNDKAIYVRCPKIPCGTRVFSYEEIYSPNDWDEDSLLGNTRNFTRLKNETNNVIDKIVNTTIVPETFDRLSHHSMNVEGKNKTADDILGSELRVVGGKASRAKAWPFLVAIRKDGRFSCGGVIINEKWILTAAHCVDGFSAHYYEIQAGLLRRFSFSPMAQTRRASYIEKHPEYTGNITQNDLALIRLDEPLLFNRWVRPTCLPQHGTYDEHSRYEPFPDTTCVTVGWGATDQGHGPIPDHLREVEVPISSECKHIEDRNDGVICAGLPQGGRDACQGDSGGPLMCIYPNSGNQWYVAGIVSHGEGCALPNEPGAYTKVSHFVNWINNIIQTRGDVMVGTRPLTSCPGFSCGGGLGKCLPASKRCDLIVNCLDAEDEINCEPHENIGVRDNDESSDDEIVGMQYDPTNFSEDKTSSVTNPKQYTMTYDENSTTKTRVQSFTTEQSISMDVTSSQQSITSTRKPQSSYSNDKELKRFTCTRLIQSLTIGKRCNRVIDCEDGTDEDNCTCKDYLANLYPKAICNGHVDCYDGSDEENCALCKDNEFVCSRSGTCIPRTRMCDRNNDCPNIEDELDCYTLTNGDHVIMDLDKRPHLNLEGVVTQWKNGNWRPVCVKHDNTALKRLSHEFCGYFGFGAVESFENIRVRDSPMEIRESKKDHLTRYEYPPSLLIPEDNENTCNGLYVTCKAILSANTSSLIVTNPKTTNLDYLWPWQASIFVNGLYHCPAILLEHSWLLATSRCVQNLDLKGNYTMALVGMAPTYLYVDGPHQQMANVDSIKILEKLDAALLHLASPVNITRYVQPIFVQKRIFPATRKDVCVATGVDEKYHTRTTFLQPVPELCPPCHRCYKNATFENCKNNTLTNWSGTIVCRGAGTWYPAAIFHEKDMLCGFQSVQTVTSIDYGNAHFTEIMEENLQPIVGPKCEGFRCPLGNCIGWHKVCDGIDDCRDRSDENVDYCKKRKELCEITDGIGCKCTKSELRCANGQCVPKEAFCDFKFDCDDRSDETPSCTCADYLKLTAPERLCNNVRDCLDKSDENSENCHCKDASFKCSGGVNATATCVSQDFVCDGEQDCPNGEDEKICRFVKGALADPTGTGQVLRRSFGVWHTECFPSPLTSTKEVSDLCRSMGYNFGSSLRFKNAEHPYGPALIPDRDNFYMIRMNQQTWITMRDNRPLSSLVIAPEPCHRAFVTCSK